MPISVVNRVRSVVVSLTEDNEDNVVTLYQNQGLSLGSELMPGYRIVSFNSFVKNLKLYADIKSLESVNLPDLNVDDSETDKLYKMLDTEWKSPRKHLDLFIASGSNEWHLIGGLSLLNPSGYPYRVYDLMQLYTDNVAVELGDNSKLGCAIKDVGYGFLLNPDKVTIHGSYVEEIFVEYPEQPINISISGFTASQPNNPQQNYSLGNSSEIGNSFLIGN